MIFLCFFLSSFLAFAQELPAKRESLAQVKDSRLSELSGLIASRKYAGKFWTHNDSGDRAQIFLINDSAKVQATFRLEDIDAVDIEDVAYFEQNGRHFLVLADIGDNRAVRKYIQLYVFEEPTYQAEQSENLILRKDIRVLTLKYEDKPRDAEAIFIDPTDLTGYLISKRGFNVGVYPFQVVGAREDKITILNLAMTLPITFVTAADISSRGDYILVKNLTKVYLWSRLPSQSVLKTLKQPYTTVQYEVEPQGEAISFATDNLDFYTISERPLGLDAYLYRYTIDSFHIP